MKFAVIALIASSASATWGVWDSDKYCDFGNEVIEEKNVDAFTYFSRSDCAAFCEAADLRALHITYGTDECCDYEAWTDGSTDCTLYLGDDTLPNYSSSGSDFQSMTFESGDYRYASLVGKTKQEVLSLRGRR